MVHAGDGWIKDLMNTVAQVDKQEVGRGVRKVVKYGCVGMYKYLYRNSDNNLNCDTRRCRC